MRISGRAGITRAGTCASLGIGLTFGLSTGTGVKVNTHGHGAIAFFAVADVLHRFKSHVLSFEVYVAVGFHGRALQQQLVGHIKLEVAARLDTRTGIGNLQ